MPHERREITAALFDFGGVILSSPFDAFADYEREHGLPEGFIRNLNATDPDDNAWAKMERSEVTIPEFCQLFEAEARAAGGEATLEPNPADHGTAAVVRLLPAAAPRRTGRTRAAANR